MFDWKNQSIVLLNERGFSVTDPGPLHAPVRKFKILRDENLELWIETEAPLDARSSAKPHLSGTIRINTDQVGIEHRHIDAKAVLSGVLTQRLDQVEDHLEERAAIHELSTTLQDPSKAAYTIEWLDNMPKRCIWPDTIKTVAAKATTIIIDDLTVSESDERVGHGSAAARLTIAGHTLYVCVPPLGDDSRAGCIVYVGAPDDKVRKKVRTALSFAFGLYLVETGHTVYDNKWQIVRALSISAYSLDARAFDLPAMPLTWLTERNFQFDIARQKLQRMVERFLAAYDDLDLANLAWAYWHARTATAHIAPAHFGAAIEALQEAFAEKHQDKIATTVFPRAEWKKLMEVLSAAIEGLSITDDLKKLLIGKIRSSNSLSQRDRLKAIAQAININIGSDEDAAWDRRNDAAHGRPIPEGKELEAIRDMKLLMVLFHRLLLSITGAADEYIDYLSPGIPPRRLKDPVPSAATAK
jgi:hypothetical protein